MNLPGMTTVIILAQVSSPLGTRGLAHFTHWLELPSSPLIKLNSQMKWAGI